MTPSVQRWIGGGNLPCSLGRANGTWPLGELALDGRRVMLRLRPHFFARLAGASSLEAVPEDLEVVFPAVGYMGGRGLGFRRRDGTEYYFWKGMSIAGPLLEMLAQIGFPVQREPRRARQVWGFLRK